MSQFCGSSAVLSRRCAVTSAASAGSVRATTAIDANAADRPLADTIFLPCVFLTASVGLPRSLSGQSSRIATLARREIEPPGAPAAFGPTPGGNAPAGGDIAPGNMLALPGPSLYKARHLTRGPWLLPSGGSIPQGRGAHGSAAAQPENHNGATRLLHASAFGSWRALRPSGPSLESADG